MTARLQYSSFFTMTGETIAPAGVYYGVIVDAGCYVNHIHNLEMLAAFDSREALCHIIVRGAEFGNRVLRGLGSSFDLHKVKTDCAIPEINKTMFSAVCSHVKLRSRTNAFYQSCSWQDFRKLELEK